MDKQKDKKDIKGQKKDKKQDEEIKRLKQKLKDLAGKYLKRKKKEEKDPKKYGKIKKRLTKRTTGAKSKSELMNLINMLKAGGKSVEKITGQPIQTALNPANVGTTAERILKDQLKKATAGPVEEFMKAKDAFLNARDKYNNGTLGINDINNLYEKTSKFAESVQDSLPSKEVLLATYSATSAGLKKLYDQLRRFMNRRAPDINQNPIDPNQAPQTGAEGPGAPQGPPPAPAPTPPPPGGMQQQEPVQEQPAPRQMASEELQDQGLIGRSVNPWVGGALIGAGALATGHQIYRSFLGAREQTQDINRLERRVEQQMDERVARAGEEARTRIGNRDDARQALEQARERRQQAIDRLNMARQNRANRQNRALAGRGGGVNELRRLDETLAMTRRQPNLRARDDERDARLVGGYAQQRLAEAGQAQQDEAQRSLQEQQMTTEEFNRRLQQIPGATSGTGLQRGDSMTTLTGLTVDTRDTNQMVDALAGLGTQGLPRVQEQARGVSDVGNVQDLPDSVPRPVSQADQRLAAGEVMDSTTVRGQMRSGTRRPMPE